MKARPRFRRERNLKQRVEELEVAVRLAHCRIYELIGDKDPCFCAFCFKPKPIKTKTD